MRAVPARLLLLLALTMTAVALGSGAAGQRYRSFNPSLPASLNPATVLNHRGGIWIKVNRAVVWEQPAP